MRIVTIVLAALLALLVLSQINAHGPFLTLRTPEFIVFLAFLLFVGILAYFGVPRRVAGMLDQRAEGIGRELSEARAVRQEAQTLLDSFEQKRRDVADQASRIVAQAREEAQAAAAQAREDAARAVQRRIQGAEEQIAAAQAKAIRQVRDQAASVAIAAARDVLAQQLTAADQSRLLDQSIATVGAKLH